MVVEKNVRVVKDRYKASKLVLKYVEEVGKVRNRLTQATVC